MALTLRASHILLLSTFLPQSPFYLYFTGILLALIDLFGWPLLIFLQCSLILPLNSDILAIKFTCSDDAILPFCFTSFNAFPRSPYRGFSTVIETGIEREGFWMPWMLKPAAQASSNNWAGHTGCGFMYACLFWCASLQAIISYFFADSLHTAVCHPFPLSLLSAASTFSHLL